VTFETIGSLVEDVNPIAVTQPSYPDAGNALVDLEEPLVGFLAGGAFVSVCRWCRFEGSII